MRTALCLTAALLGGCAQTPSTPAPPAEAATCPAAVPAGARCFRGLDAHGAPYWAAIPAGWQPATGVLVVHAHGGPDLGASTHARSGEDLQRWAVTVQAGHAWVGASYRRGGLGVAMAAEDVERARQAFVQQHGQPRRTLLHGQSYGAGVASIAAERYGSAYDGGTWKQPAYDGGTRKQPAYDGLVLTSGVLGGGVAAYTFRLDVRAVYQAVCGNHPRPDEPQYPLWQGLPIGSPLTRAQLAERVRECIGGPHKTPQQQANLAALTAALPVTERSLLPHLQWATWHFQDLTQQRLGNRNPFDNTTARYAGIDNARVARHAADPAAVAQLDADSRPTGRTRMPTIGLRGIGDATAFVELDTEYRRIRDAAGTGDWLVQLYTDSAEHSFLHAPEYPAVFAALLDWIDRGERPTAAAVAARCAGLVAQFGDACRIQPGYVPQALSARVPPR